MDKEIEDMQNDPNIKKVWKNPRDAKDMAFIFFMFGMILGLVIVSAMFFIMIEFVYDGTTYGDYQRMILDYSDCHSMKLMLSNESLGKFHDRLLAQWMVNCGK